MTEEEEEFYKKYKENHGINFIDMDDLFPLMNAYVNQQSEAKDKEIKFLKEEHECNLLIQQSQRIQLDNKQKEIEELTSLIQVSEDKYREVVTEKVLKGEQIQSLKEQLKAKEGGINSIIKFYEKYNLDDRELKDKCNSLIDITYLDGEINSRADFINKLSELLNK